MSMIREMSASIQPPKKPASRPSMPPMTTMPTVAPTAIDQRRPRAVDGVRVVVAAEHVEAERVVGSWVPLRDRRTSHSCAGPALVHSRGKTAIDTDDEDECQRNHERSGCG